MPLTKSGSVDALHNNIKEMISSGYPQKQAIAAALANQRKYKMSEGGRVEDPDEDLLSEEVDDEGIDDLPHGEIKEALEDSEMGFAMGGELPESDSTPDMPAELEHPLTSGRVAIMANGDLDEASKEAIRKRREESIAKMRSKAKRS